jgi:hypothetical protein
LNPSVLEDCDFEPPFFRGGKSRFEECAVNVPPFLTGSDFSPQLGGEEIRFRSPRLRTANKKPKNPYFLLDEAACAFHIQTDGW